ncbi:MAG: Uncharacterized protein XE05_1121 [Thermotogales bacterium 46_20]|nr:MAG: Uncharacterized protein XE05_1121 [Thermotogales bacterium 46_20]
MSLDFQEELSVMTDAVQAEERSGQKQSNQVTVIPIRLDSPLSPEENYGNSGEFILSAIGRTGVEIEQGDVIVVTSKIISILENRCFKLEEVRPSLRAKLLGKVFGKSPNKVELILREGPVSAVIPFKWVLKDKRISERILGSSFNVSDSLKIIDTFKNVFVVKRYGIYLDEAGIDASNLPEGWAGLLPVDSCRSAREIREVIESNLKKHVAVVITDTTSVLGRTGSIDIALGFSGIDPIGREHARTDLFHRPKSGGMDVIVDSISAFAGSVMGGFTECTPICVIKGLRYKRPDRSMGMSDLLYPPGVKTKSFLKALLPNLLLWFLLFVTLPFSVSKNSRS